MLQRFAIVGLLLSFALLQMHNFIPHLHVATPQPVLFQQQHSHKHHHSDHTQHTQSKQDHSCGHFAHNEDFGKVFVQLQERQKFDSTLCFFGCFFDAALFNKLSANNHSKDFPPGNSTSLHLIFLSHSVPLRAPPTLQSA
jgi:hypothetical protein